MSAAPALRSGLRPRRRPTSALLLIDVINPLDFERVVAG